MMLSMRDPLFIAPDSAFAAGTKAREEGIPHAHRRWMTTIHRRQAKTWPQSGPQIGAAARVHGRARRNAPQRNASQR